MSTVALETYLAPIREFLTDDRIEEIIINRPGEVFIERAGTWERYDIEALDQRRLNQLTDLTATYTHQAVSAETPLLSAQLPGGERIQVVMPPACPPDMFGIAIRKPSALKFTLADYSRRGAFGGEWRNRTTKVTPVDLELARLLRQDKIEDFLRLAIKSKKNIIISGGTSSGKTTVLKAFIEEMGAEERILTIEDVREVTLPHANKLHLLASKGGQGVARVTVGSLLEACLRLRPDRILLGEMRGAEAADFLELINTGHPGSISTVHADSPRLAFERLSFMVKRKEGFETMDRADIIDYIKSVVHIVVQCQRFEGGFRGMSDIWYCHADEIGE